MGAHRLTPTSYMVLGLVLRNGPITSYNMKQLAKLGLGNFWSFPHSQLYAEPPRLVEDGMLTAVQEQTGRRRRLYHLTDKGREALESWLAESTSDPTEIRDEALLKLFFCSLAEPGQIRSVAEKATIKHKETLAEWEAMMERLRGLSDPCQLATLELGIRYQRIAIDFWAEVAQDTPGG